MKTVKYYGLRINNCLSVTLQIIPKSSDFLLIVGFLMWLFATEGDETSPLFLVDGVFDVDFDVAGDLVK